MLALLLFVSVFKNPVYPYLNLKKRKKKKTLRLTCLGASSFTVCRKSEMMATVELGKLLRCECLTEIRQFRN